MTSISNLKQKMNQQKRNSGSKEIWDNKWNKALLFITFSEARYTRWPSFSPR